MQLEPPPFAKMRLPIHPKSIPGGPRSKSAPPLAEAGISFFFTSKFDTDYILAKTVNLQRAITALSAAGHSRLNTVPK